MNISYKKTKGLTLMELMIAMVIGLMLLGGAVTMFINNKQIYKNVNEVGRMQENARFAVEMLTRDIRMAGFFGCHHNVANVTNHIIGSATVGSLYDHTFGLEGIEGGAVAWSPSAATDAAAFGISYDDAPANIGTRFTDATVPDAITVRYLSGEFWDVVEDNDPGADTYEGGDNGYMAGVGDAPNVSTKADHPAAGDRANNFAPGELLSVSDCSSSEIFQLTEKCTSDISTYGCTGTPSGLIEHAVNGGDAVAVPGNISGSFTRGYGAGTNVRRYTAVRYYIGNGEWGGPSLFRQYPVLNDLDYTITITNQELLEGVENMQIMYGVDADGNGVPENYYVAGHANLDDTTEWANVSSVKIALLLRTVQEDFTSGVDLKDDYRLLSQDIDPLDVAVRRRVVSTIIQLRNRISR